MRQHVNSAAAALATAFLILGCACNPQPSHPNQINSFDGATYDSLTVAHSALTTLRAQLVTTYPQYAPVFNQSAAAYSTAYQAYSLFRTTASGQAAEQAAVSVQIANLAVSIVALENAFQADLHVSPSAVLDIERRAAKIRARAKSNASLADILVELEIAATIAETVPATQPYAALAALVIDTSRQALAAEQAAAGQDIDLTAIQPVESL